MQTKRIFWPCGFFVIVFWMGCSAHQGKQISQSDDGHWYTSIEGDFMVKTPASLDYREDTVTLHNEGKEYFMSLGVHRGDLNPWFFEVLHTDKPSFWKMLSEDEKSWWLKAMAQQRFKPLGVFKEEAGALWAEQNGRQLEIRATQSNSRLYLLVAAVPPGSLDAPEVKGFFNSFQINR